MNAAAEQLKRKCHYFQVEQRENDLWKRWPREFPSHIDAASNARVYCGSGKWRVIEVKKEETAHPCDDAEWHK